MVIHPREHDLGHRDARSWIWIIDDISPLRGLTKDSLEKEISFTRAETDGCRRFLRGAVAGHTATLRFVGPNSTGDAVITYYQKKRHIFGRFEDGSSGSGGHSPRTIPSSKRRGLNRTTWSMRLRAPRVPPEQPVASGTGIARVIPDVHGEG